MRKLGVWGLAASLAVGLAAQGGRADDDREDEKPPTRTWWERLTGKEPQPDENKSDPADEPKKATEGDGAPEDPKARTAREARLRQEAYKAREDYLRRQAVCDRLKEAAYQLGDTRMEKRAEELFERAWEVYRKKQAYFQTQLPPDDAEEEPAEAATPKVERKEAKP